MGDESLAVSMNLPRDGIPAAAELIAEAKVLFGDVPRPDNFTDFEHCCECAEHDETLQAHTPDTIGYAELGTPGWDPVCFATPEAYKYYFPAFVRLALEGSDDTYYLDQFLFHLTYDGPRNEHWRSFTAPQRKYVENLLAHLFETKAEEIDWNFDADDLLRAIELWSQAAP